MEISQFVGIIRTHRFLLSWSTLFSLFIFIFEFCLMIKMTIEGVGSQSVLDRHSIEQVHMLDCYVYIHIKGINWKKKKWVRLYGLFLKLWPTDWTKLYGSDPILHRRFQENQMNIDSESPQCPSLLLPKKVLNRHYFLFF